MKLSDFLELYNFKYIDSNSKEDTQIIRIYLDLGIWFEFGVNDWGWQSKKSEIIPLVLREDLLSKNVFSFNYDDSACVFAIWLDNEEETTE